MEPFEKIRLSNQPRCPRHKQEFANLVCIDPQCNASNNKGFKILCPECEHQDNIHKDYVKDKAHSVKSLINFLNHVVNQANIVGGSRYTYDNLTKIMDEIISQIKEIITKSEKFINNIEYLKEGIEEVFGRKDDAKITIGEYLNTIRSGNTDDVQELQDNIEEIGKNLRYESTKREWIVDIQKFQKEWSTLDREMNQKYEENKKLIHDMNTAIASFLKEKKPVPSPTKTMAYRPPVERTASTIESDGQSFTQTDSCPTKNNLYLTNIALDAKKKFIIKENQGKFLGLGIATDAALSQLKDSLDPSNELKNMEGIYMVGSNEKTYGKCVDTDMEGMKLSKNWCVELYVRNSRLTIKSVKNPDSGEYGPGSKAKNCQITMNKNENLSDYKVFVCLTANGDSIQEVKA